MTKNRLAWLVATCGGAGHLPLAPGTWGSLVAVAIVLAVPYPAALAAGLLFPGIWAAGELARSLGKKDPQTAVVDELVGQWIALSGSSLSWQSLVAGFILFRIFDMTKPWPVRRFESLSGGWGIVLDDVAAGIYACLVMSGLRWFNLIS